MTRYMFSVEYGDGGRLDLDAGYYVVSIKGARMFAMHALDTLEGAKRVHISDDVCGRRPTGTVYHRGNGINRTYIWLKEGEKTAYAVKRNGTIDKGAPFGV